MSVSVVSSVVSSTTSSTMPKLLTSSTVSSTSVSAADVSTPDDKDVIVAGRRGGCGHVVVLRKRAGINHGAVTHAVGHAGPCVAVADDLSDHAIELGVVVAVVNIAGGVVPADLLLEVGI